MISSDKKSGVESVISDLVFGLVCLVISMG